MAETQTRSEARLVAELNDLLQLDHDAVQAYTLAIKGMQDEQHRQTLIRYRGDHERHIQELTELIESHRGIPIQLPHLPTGVFKLAVQAAGDAGGDREVLLAFKANERQVRDKYARIAEGPHPPDVAEVLHRGAADEEKHYAWVSDVLEQMGAGTETAIGRTEAAFETVHSRTADLVEGVERRAMAGAERMRRSPLPGILLGLAGLLVLRRILR
jgi:rubrerythrin